MEQQTNAPIRIGLPIGTIAIIGLIALIVGFVLGFIVHKKYRPCITLPVVTTTTVIHDTVQAEIPPPIVKYKDTVIWKIRPNDNTPGIKDSIITPVTPADTTSDVIDSGDGTIGLIMQSKVYQTDDYRAVVSGWRPSLDSIEVYGKTVTTTNTVTKVKNPWLALTGGVGVGYTTDKKIVPFVGVSLGIILWSK